MLHVYCVPPLLWQTAQIDDFESRSTRMSADTASMSWGRQQGLPASSASWMGTVGAKQPMRSPKRCQGS